MDLEEDIKRLPASPGVYIMKADNGEVLYVGKANNIKKRVSSYFLPSRKRGDRIASMVGRVKEISYLPAATEAEALLYENGLIKRLLPRYNVALRDGKSYPMLKLTMGEKYPRLMITRERKPDGSLYYGPYSDARLLRRSLIELRQIFPIRNCARLPKRVCLDYHIKQCLGPCVGGVSDDSYAEIVSELKLFLGGGKGELIKVLTDRMKDASSRQDFEEAARLKNRIDVLGSMSGRAVDYRPAGELDELKAVLGMKSRPDNIEAFDVSNIMGALAVGAMVTFRKGRPNKSGYRLFRIKTVPHADDYAMIREIVRRRYSALLKEGRRMPDLILIDGGRGHLSSAMAELGRLGLSEIPVIGIAKEFERIYTVNKKDPIILPRESKALHLLKRVRDEAHRFAISYHKRILSKNVSSSALDGIPAVGRMRKRALLGHFGGIEGIKKAGINDLVGVKGIDEKTARNIIEYFKKR